MFTYFSTVSWCFSFHRDHREERSLCEAKSPLMPLGRGADEAATARKGQRENRDESGERRDSGVEHLVSHFIFAKVHNLCGQGSRHLVQRLERHYVVG